MQFIIIVTEHVIDYNISTSKYTIAYKVIIKFKCNYNVN